MTAISKDVYFDALDDIFDEYDNAYHKTIKMKPVDVGDNSFIEYYGTLGIIQSMRWPCRPIILSIGHFKCPAEVQLNSC